jgi:hydrogenase/urease accessory protein HupE
VNRSIEKAIAVGTWMSVLVLFAPVASYAHEVRPACLELRETAAGAYDVLWKVPAQSADVGLDLRVILPPETRRLTSPLPLYLGGAQVERSRVALPGGLRGREIRIDGLEATFTDVLVRIQNLDGTVEIERLTPSRAAFTVEAVPGRLEVMRAYVGLGIEHILRGVDHLLFVLGLLLIVHGTRRLLKTITAFTLAHSITLAAATLGWATVPVEPLNACIALSICFLGPEIARTWTGQSSLTLRQPWLVAFIFGLLHGFGFATGLRATGVPAGELPVALLSFNLGVELGQLGFVAIILLLIWSWLRLEIVWPRWLARLPGYGIGSLGAFWAIQRSLMMFGYTR